METNRKIGNYKEDINQQKGVSENWLTREEMIRYIHLLPIIGATRMYYNANDAFRTLFQDIMQKGVDERENMQDKHTKALYNQGFYIFNPLDREIKARKWDNSYAEKEWGWYLSGDRNVATLQEHAKTWGNAHNGDYIVNSNYGYLWNQNGQLDNCIGKLVMDEQTRQAVITLYDGKDIANYTYDTPCTNTIMFFIVKGFLHMRVDMRSCDLVYGFCNDQYCFSKLFELVLQKINEQRSIQGKPKLQLGLYYHAVGNLHIYKKHFDLKIDKKIHI